MSEHVVPQTAVAALRMAVAGRCKCRKCGAELPLQDALTSWLGGALVFAVCVPCLSAGNHVSVRRVPTGIEVAINRESAPLVLVPGTAPALPRADPLPSTTRPVRVEHDPTEPLVLGAVK